MKHSRARAAGSKSPTGVALDPLSVLVDPPGIAVDACGGGVIDQCCHGRGDGAGKQDVVACRYAKIARSIGQIRD